MTTDADNIPAPSPTTEPPATDRLPDDHPAAKALAKANKEAETLRLKLQEIEDRDKSELQKLQEAVAERDAKLNDLPKQARAQAIRFASTASQRGFLDPEDALAFMPPDIDMSDAAAVKAALDELAERKPHLVRSSPKAPPLPKRPKPVEGDADPTNNSLQKQGKERAAAALRQFRNT